MCAPACRPTGGQGLGSVPAVLAPSPAQAAASRLRAAFLLLSSPQLGTCPVFSGNRAVSSRTASALAAAASLQLLAGSRERKGALPGLGVTVLEELSGAQHACWVGSESCALGCRLCGAWGQASSAGAALYHTL